MGFCEKDHETKVKMDTNQFYEGATAKLTLDIDNSEAGSGVAGVKVQLLRNLHAEIHGEPTALEQIIGEKAHPIKVAGGQKDQIEVEMQIPTQDPFFKDNYEELPPELKMQIKKEDMPMMQDFSQSFFGQIIKVWYSMRVFVKHDGLFDFGEGAFVRFPIKIFSRPNNLNTQQVAFVAPA